MIAPADALVFFGATGDLAYKKIFPSLQAMVKRDQSVSPSGGWQAPTVTGSQAPRG
jgi:glucose-6-phosphate 1-dehydrogenase